MVADGDGGCGSGLIGLMADGGCGSGLIGLIWVCVEVWRHGDDGVLIGVDFSLCGLIDVG